MTISIKKSKPITHLVNPIIHLETPIKKAFKKGKYISITCHNTPDKIDSGAYEINLLYYGGRSPEEWLPWKDELLKALEGQCISNGPNGYIFTERFVTSDAKVIFT